MELKEELESVEEGVALKDEVDTLEALKALGYSHTEACEALKEIPREVTGTNDRIKYALKMFGK